MTNLEPKPTCNHDLGQGPVTWVAIDATSISQRPKHGAAKVTTILAVAQYWARQDNISGYSQYQILPDPNYGRPDKGICALFCTTSPGRDLVSFTQ